MIHLPDLYGHVVVSEPICMEYVVLLCNCFDLLVACLWALARWTRLSDQMATLSLFKISLSSLAIMKAVDNYNRMSHDRSVLTLCNINVVFSPYELIRDGHSSMIYQVIFAKYINTRYHGHSAKMNVYHNKH